MRTWRLKICRDNKYVPGIQAQKRATDYTSDELETAFERSMYGLAFGDRCQSR